MSPVAVVTDTTQYLPRAVIERHRIELVSLYVNWNGRIDREADLPDFDGFYDFLRSGGDLPSTSQRLNLSVQPRIIIRRSVTRARVGQTPLISGVIQPAKARVRLIINRVVRGRTVRVASIQLRVIRGRFRKAYRLSVPGLYSYRVLFPGDAANLKAGSTTLHVRAV